MALNKKQKKQIDVLRKKIASRRPLLAAAKEQNDDPADLTRIESEIQGFEQQIKTIQEG